MQEIRSSETLYHALLINTAVKIRLLTLLFVTKKRRFGSELEPRPQQLKSQIKGKFLRCQNLAAMLRLMIMMMMIMIMMVTIMMVMIVIIITNQTL